MFTNIILAIFISTNFLINIFHTPCHEWIYFPKMKVIAALVNHFWLRVVCGCVSELCYELYPRLQLASCILLSVSISELYFWFQLQLALSTIWAAFFKLATFVLVPTTLWKSPSQHFGIQIIHLGHLDKTKFVCLLMVFIGASSGPEVKRTARDLGRQVWACRDSLNN